MSRYSYVKQEPVTLTVAVLPALSILFGISLLAWIAWPILAFQFLYGQISGIAISPLAEEVVKPAVASEVSDLTRASSWFPTSKAGKTVTPVDAYMLSIPKLRISKALVKIGTDDLSKNLIHYGGSGLPGKFGKAVIFGHSILPQFYDPTNYLAIFSLLPTLKNGDDIFVHFDGVDYRYEVLGKRVTTPQDISGLEERFDDSYLTLVTCAPPGTYLARLWVTAKLRPFSNAQ
jgi:sortase A